VERRYEEHPQKGGRGKGANSKEGEKKGGFSSFEKSSPWGGRERELVRKDHEGV